MRTTRSSNSAPSALAALAAGPARSASQATSVLRALATVPRDDVDLALAVPWICDALLRWDRDADVVRAGCTALGGLTDELDARQETLGATYGIPALLARDVLGRHARVRRETRAVEERVYWALERVVGKHADNTRVLLDMGLHTRVCITLRTELDAADAGAVPRRDDPLRLPLVTRCCAMLHRLSWIEGVEGMLMSEPCKVHDLIVRAARTYPDDPELVRRCCAVLGNLVYDTAHELTLTRQPYRMQDLVVDAMQRFPDHPQLHSHAALALYNLTSTRRAYHRVVAGNENVVGVVIDAVVRFDKHIMPLEKLVSCLSRMACHDESIILRRATLAGVHRVLLWVLGEVADGVMADHEELLAESGNLLLRMARMDPSALREAAVVADVCTAFSRIVPAAGPLTVMRYRAIQDLLSVLAVFIFAGLQQVNTTETLGGLVMLLRARPCYHHRTQDMATLAVKLLLRALQNEKQQPDLSLLCRRPYDLHKTLVALTRRFRSDEQLTAITMRLALIVVQHMGRPELFTAPPYALHVLAASLARQRETSSTVLHLLLHLLRQSEDAAADSLLLSLLGAPCCLFATLQRTVETFVEDDERSYALRLMQLALRVLQRDTKRARTLRHALVPDPKALRAAVGMRHSTWTSSLADLDVDFLRPDVPVPALASIDHHIDMTFLEADDAGTTSAAA